MNKIIKKDKCPLCGSSNFQSYLDLDHRTIVQCLGCKHIFAQEYSIDAPWSCAKLFIAH